MKFRVALILVSLVLFLTGCEAVYAPAPIGETVVKLNVEEWQGTWLASEMVITTTVLDPEQGLLQAAWIERGEEGAKFEVMEGQVRDSGGLLFANIKDDNEEGVLRYLWLRVEKSDTHFTLWSPDITQFKAMIEDGSLPGEVIEDGVVLGELKPEHIALINDPATKLLDWKDPAVFVRIAD